MLNVIVSPGNSMIIDWMLATRGNPLADIASAVLQLRYGELPRGLIARSALGMGKPRRAAKLLGASSAGLDSLALRLRL